MWNSRHRVVDICGGKNLRQLFSSKLRIDGKPRQLHHVDRLQAAIRRHVAEDAVEQIGVGRDDHVLLGRLV